MLSVIGEEYVSYSEGTKGQYTPLIAISKYDGTLSYREIVREDLLRIPDDKLAPGGWLFRKTQNTSSSWVKRFALVRGDFLFFFHSPQNEKPIALVPLQECNVVVPENREKSFDDSRSFRANEGYEFDIRHTTLSTVRLYALSEQERSEWVASIRERITSSHNRQLLNGSKPPRVVYEKNTNITISGTRLSGVSLTGPNGAPHSPSRGGGGMYGNYNYDAAAAPPPPPPYGEDDGYSVASSTTMSPFNPNKPPPYQASMNNSSSYSLNSYVNDNASVGSSNYSHAHNQVPFSPQQHQQGGLSNTQVPFSQVPFSHQQQPPLPPLPRGNKLDKSAMNLDLFSLEKNLQKKFTEQEEARKRESAIRNKIKSRESILMARTQEEKNPLSLAEMFRVSLFFIDEELVEDAQEGIQLQVPHLKGEAIEQMLVTCYQRYCGESGFMSLEEFVEFMDDVNILHTHAPHDDNDEPLDEYVTLLDPIRLLTLVPRNYGFASTDSTYAISEKLMKAAKKDKFIINFTQFYQLLLRITQIVYQDLYSTDATLAFNKLLQESILPLFVWSKGRHKRGAVDVLVLEERILLILTLYAPNLWRVFLTYAADAVGKVAEVNQPFPENAQNNERGMFKLPPAAPARHEFSKTALGESLMITEAAALRFARDYGITPQLVTTKQLRDIYKRTNRQKIVISSRLSNRDQLQTKPHSAAQIKEIAAKKGVAAPMHFGVKETKITNSKTPKVSAANLEDNEAPPPPPPTNAIPAASPQVFAMSFSEFVEFIARIAIEGMQQPNYHLVFPTPFSKVLAILTVWGVADLKRLEEVRIVRVEDNGGMLEKRM